MAGQLAGLLCRARVNRIKILLTLGAGRGGSAICVVLVMRRGLLVCLRAALLSSRKFQKTKCEENLLQKSR
jgi:hypothetical protein